MRKLQYDFRLAFQVEKELIRLHPRAEYIRVEARGEFGLRSTCLENGQYVNVNKEVTAYLNRRIQTTGPETAPPLATPECV